MRFDFKLQLGAFLAGALLAETNFRTQIEADIRPFRGLLLGLFFVTTGSSIDMQVYNIMHCSVVRPYKFLGFCVFDWQIIMMRSCQVHKLFVTHDVRFW
jgi:Kef-type K+ transport system membrane component KefB